MFAALAATAAHSYAATAGTEPAEEKLSIHERLAWQIALDRVGYSPGVIDAKCGGKTEAATREYQRARGLAVTGILDAPTAAALDVAPGRALTTYTIRAADLAELGPHPRKWADKAKLDRLAYPSLDELLAEKFHCTRALLADLNPGSDIAHLQPGRIINVPALSDDVPIARGDRVEVNLSEKVIHVLAGGKVVGMFYCSVAKDKANLPSGPASVVCISENPTYLFDPEKWPEVKDVHEKLNIPPGPRNPVGLCWIGLSLPGYGMHGTPTPEMIGKTGSHGCIRLANWDALRLGKMIRVGTPVSFTQRGKVK
jgi:lipoprotein-anchoring transpeptidase ErfK/SrfK